MTAELLSYSRLDIAPHELRPAWFSPEDLAGACMEEVRDEAEAAGVTLHWSARDIPARWHGDTRMLSRALGNVLRNAVAHAPAGTAVQVEASRTPGRLEIQVMDAGPGVPPEMLERIFEPFFRADAARNRATGGVGLGLAIARRCMEAHGGGAEAAPGVDGRGLRVRLWLPDAGGDGGEAVRT